MDQKSQNIALIKKKNLRSARPTLSLNFIFDFLGHFSIRCIYYFSKKVLIILRWNTKHAEYWLGVQFPLNKIYYTANRVGQNLSTFAQRWVKYQQSKLFGQFDPTMGKT